MKSFSSFFFDKKVLITGDTGFKGSWMAIWLKELGAEVYGFSLPPNSHKDNFVVTNLKERIKHIDGDIRDLEGLTDFFNEIKPEIAFHLAAQPLVIESYKDPVTTFATNVIGTVNFLEAVRKTPSVKAAIIITSDKCYQNNEWFWGYREIDPLGGTDPYSASKACTELVTSSYINSFFNIELSAAVASVRAGNVIGGGDWAENRIIPDFFKSCEKNEAIKLRYPYSTRPWQHVLEPISGYLLLASKLCENRSKFQGGWNFGPIPGNSKSVIELIEELIGLGKTGSAEYSEQPLLHEAKLLQLDISKAINCLGWSPVLNFKETVRFTFDGYRNKSLDIYELRVNQIKLYSEMGKRIGLNYFN